MARGSVRRPIMGGSNNGIHPERYEYWRVGYGSSDLFPLEFWIDRIGEYHSKPNYATGDFHWTHSAQLFYHISGEAMFESRNRNTPVTPGDLFIIPAEQAFNYRGKDIRFHWLSLSGAWPAILGDANEPRHFVLDYDREIEAKLVEIREVLILQKPGYPLKAVGIFYELVARLEELSHGFTLPRSTTYPDVVRNAITYLIETYDQPFDATRTAAAANISQSHLRALFDKWLGESPRQFHTRYRIDQAKRLLREQQLQISEVAPLVGFDDARYFSRVFKRLTGLSPSQYVQEMS